MGLYLAHTAEDGRTQTVLQHLTGTAKQCAAFADTFHAPEQGQLAGSAHDVGKYSDAFQRRLLHDGPKVDHATAGAFECLKLGQLFAAFAVAGHHGGLPDGGGRGDGPDAGTFFGRINRAAQDKQGILSLMESDFFPFRTVAERFHLIDSPTVTVYVPRGEEAELIARLRGGEHSRDLYRRLGQYGVSVYEDHFKALDRAGVLDRLEDGSFVLNDPSLYSETTGLSMEAEGGKANFV